jgi:DNA topoisomerase-3
MSSTDKLFICEKPSQAASVAAALGSPQRTETHWETAGGRVTWAVGHLREQDRPDDYNPNWAWKSLEISMLPMIPERFTYHTREGMAGRLKEIGALLKKARVAVVATDGGREGEAIGREILDFHKWEGPIERLWLGALDEESILEALKSIRPGSATLALYQAAQARSQADWLIGMNGTSGVTLTSPRVGGVYSVGRVQTPTLALVVRRDREIASFKPVDYFEFDAKVRAGAVEVTMKHSPKERILSKETAAAIAAGLAGGSAEIISSSEDAHQGPPLPYDITTLQGDADSRLGLGADATLKIAQALYEKYKVTTYPRSECNYLPESQKALVPQLWANAVKLKEFEHLAGLAPVPRSAIFNTAKVGEHNAIVPTTVVPSLGGMEENERKLYLMIVARYLAGLLPDYRFKKLELSMTVGGREFVLRGTQPIDLGWKAAIRGPAAEIQDKDEAIEGEDEEAGPVPVIAPGVIGTLGTVVAVKCSTAKPKAYTEGTLLKDMKAIAKFVSDPQKKARLKETSGIGTAATRPKVLEDLKGNEYLKKTKRKLTATAKGHALIERLERDYPALVDAGETAIWEDALDEVAQGRRSAEEFLGGIKGQVRGLVAAIVRSAPPAAPKVEVSAGIFLSDHGDYYTWSGAKGRLFKEFRKHLVTEAEFGSLLRGETLTFADCKWDDGKPVGPRQVRYNPKKDPFPGLEFISNGPAAPAMKRLV